MVPVTVRGLGMYGGVHSFGALTALTCSIPLVSALL